MHLSGTLAAGPDCQALQAAVQRQFADEHFSIVLDLNALTFVDSAGLGELVALRRTAQDAGGGVVLAGPRGKVKDILELTRLDQLLPVYPTEAEAIVAVGGGS